MSKPTLSLRHIKLKPRMMLILGLISLIQTGILGQFAISYLDNALDEQIGRQAMFVAQTIAVTPEVIAAIERRDTDYLQPLSFKLAAAANARFVVFGDKEGIRLAHPNPQRLGKSMADDDGDLNEPALVHGESYISKAKGSIGWSMRGKAAIKNRQGDIVGIVSVGFLLDTVEGIVAQNRINMLIAITVSFGLSIVTAMWFATHFKKAIFDLEPEEIGRLFEERHITLETIREGVIAINQAGKITTLNHAAINTLNLDQSIQYTGKPILDVLPDSGILDVLKTGTPQFDQEVWLNDRHLIVNRIPLIQSDVVTGVVSSFRQKDELALVSRQLTRIRQYAESLRSQSHEYNNKLHTIAGLIQIGAHDKALQVIGSESAQHQTFIQQLMVITDNNVLAGCLMGKYNRAREIGLKLIIDPESQMHDIPPRISSDQLVSIVGNLLDNALEATLSEVGTGGTVSLSMTDIGNDLIFEIEDQGGGLDLDEQERIFEQGYTTKPEQGHGIGLHLVKSLIEHHGGMLTIDSPIEHHNGSRFTLYLPKEHTQ